MTGAQEVACSEFVVGSPQWTQCVKDSATGGGLMPWIVVIPLGVMVLGMIAMFAWQFTRRPGSRPTVSGQAGAWLLFMSLIEGSIGAGMAVGEARADGSNGGYGIAAYILLGTAAILFMVGLGLSVRGSRQRRIARDGLPGHARVLSMAPTGSRINHQPVIGYELEVTVPGRAPYVVGKRVTTPSFLLTRVQPGTVLFVKVDRDKPMKLVVDWTPLMQAGPVATTPTPGQPAVDAEGFRI